MTTAATPSIRVQTARAAKPATSLISPIALCVLLMFGVLAFGAVETWSTSVLEIGAEVLFASWAIAQALRPHTTFTWNRIFLPMVVFAASVITQIVFNLTAYRYATLVAGLQYVAYGALLFAAVQVVTDEDASRIVLLTLGIFGAAVAVFAICQNLTSTKQIYWFRDLQAGGSIFGPYVNHDHYAGMMEILTPLLLALCLSRKVRGARRALVGFGAVIMAASIVLSQSRGGTVSLIAELLFFAWLALRLPQRRSMRTGLLLLVITLVVCLAWLGSASMWHHFSDVKDATRLAIARDSIRMFRARPLLGWGLGAFATAYPAYRSFYTDLYVNAAHNDYIQILVETGLIGFACLLWFIAILYRRGMKELHNWSHSWTGILRLGCLVGCTGIVVHSAFDFNLQIPANAALFFVFAGIAANPPTRSYVGPLFPSDVTSVRNRGQNGRTRY